MGVKYHACCVLPDKKLTVIAFTDPNICTRLQWRNAKVKSNGSGWRVWLPTPACVIIAVRLKTRTHRGQAICTSVQPASTEDCTSGNQKRTQNQVLAVGVKISDLSKNFRLPLPTLNPPFHNFRLRPFQNFGLRYLNIKGMKFGC